MPQTSTTTPVSGLPEPLLARTEDLAWALKTPRVATWPDGTAYLPAEEPEAIRRILVDELHSHLASARIALLFREEIAGRGKTILGKASKASAKIAFLAGLDFIIEFNWTTWYQLNGRQRIALVDHELAHCGYDSEKDRYLLWPHDVEEFGSIVQRWGLWLPDLATFGQVVRQLSLPLDEARQKKGTR